MIDEIRVKNLALIREATLTPATGLTVLTGETGAGKTALVSAVKLLMGQRADKSDVRQGEASLLVEGRFLGGPLEENDGDGDDDGDDDGELVVSRTVTSDGRSRANLNGEMATMRQLSERVATRVDLCGQHEHQALMRTASHVTMLDDWAADEVAQVAESYREAFRTAKDAAAELERVSEAAGASNAKLDEARFALRRIDEVNPRVGEMEELRATLSKAENAEALVRATSTVHDALAGDGGALDQLGQAANALESVASYDEGLAAYVDSIRETTYVLEDIARDARDYRDSIEFDEETLVAQQERLSALLGLVRQYGPRIEDVLGKREEAADLVSLVDDSERRLKEAREAHALAEARLSERAAELSQVRKRVAPRFAEAVSAQMARLEMGSAQLVCSVQELERCEWTLAGPDAVEFLFKPGSGMEARPLARIASGGELSRVLLAIKVIMGERDQVDTLIFDEVDAGTGGATAIALAEVLADLAKTHQVIVVTHLAQVAVRADVHYVVKKSDGELPETRLVVVEGEDREGEIARMLSGSNTETSMAHARELLAETR